LWSCVPSGWMSHTPSEPLRFVWYAIQAVSPLKGFVNRVGVAPSANVGIDVVTAAGVAGGVPWGAQAASKMRVISNRIVWAGEKLLNMAVPLFPSCFQILTIYLVGNSV
jgi:hypothetical protein